MRIKKCPKCKIYTLKENCNICGTITISPHPLRFSPEDKWGEWRRKAKIRISEKEKSK